MASVRRFFSAFFGSLLLSLAFVGRVGVPILAGKAVERFFADERAWFFLRIRRIWPLLVFTLGAAVAEVFLRAGAKALLAQGLFYRESESSGFSGPNEEQRAGGDDSECEFGSVLLAAESLVLCFVLSASLLFLEPGCAGAFLLWALLLAVMLPGGGLREAGSRGKGHFFRAFFWALCLSLSVGAALVVAWRNLEGKASLEIVSTCAGFGIYLLASFLDLRNGLPLLRAAFQKRDSSPGEISTSGSRASTTAFSENRPTTVSLSQLAVSPATEALRDATLLVSCEGVSLSSENGKTKLSDLNFSIPRGSIVCFRCEDPSKLELLKKFFMGALPSPNGKIKVDRELSELERHVLVLDSQSLAVKDLSILDFLKSFRPEASLSEVILSVEKAGASLFLPYLPSGLSTPLNCPEVILSPGQKARLQVAGALLSRSRLVVLDRLLEGLDPRSSCLIVKALKEEAEVAKRSFIVLTAREFKEADLCYSF